MSRYEAVIFDFDGTLVDSAPGIMSSLQALMEEYGREPLTDAQLRACVGPPIDHFFPELLHFQGEAFAPAVNAYRRLFNERALPNLRAFLGAAELLRDLQAAGIRTGVATCKRQDLCVEQAEKLGLAPYLDVIGGAQPALEMVEKADILRDVLHRLAVAPRCAVMIGDRMYDLIGANQAGVPGIGVLYGGCGTREELEEHHPIAIVNTLEELRPLLL